ncbi:hypothetical protein ILUMI_26715 [Ignelater luminosus]|uniref:Reverse transcriptase domain-containing protein n=1 Tax=Ignelater luminosus TaxID=2038154 RepID=A0A8K0C5F5_IGNLU|nr:hypothetical protein ILUMI_26715 [Ignelater luminosus]
MNANRESLKTTFHETAAEVLAKTPKEQQNDWLNEECKQRLQPFSINCRYKYGKNVPSLKNRIRKFYAPYTTRTRSLQILAYADDIVLIGRTRQEAIEAFTHIKTAAESMGLLVIFQKTKYISVTPGAQRNNLKIHNDTVEMTFIQNSEWSGKWIKTGVCRIGSCYWKLLRNCMGSISKENLHTEDKEEGRAKQRPWAENVHLEEDNLEQAHSDQWYREEEFNWYFMF